MDQLPRAIHMVRHDNAPVREAAHVEASGTAGKRKPLIELYAAWFLKHYLEWVVLLQRLKQIGSYY